MKRRVGVDVKQLVKSLEDADFPFQVEAIEDGTDNSVHTFHIYKADHRPRPPPYFQIYEVTEISTVLKAT